MTFAWPCLLSKNCVDPATKYHGHLLLSHIIAKFAIHKRIVLQVTTSCDRILPTNVSMYIYYIHVHVYGVSPTSSQSLPSTNAWRMTHCTFGNKGCHLRKINCQYAPLCVSNLKSGGTYCTYWNTGHLIAYLNVYKAWLLMYMYLQ